MVLLPCTEVGTQCGCVQHTVQIWSGSKIFQKAEGMLSIVENRMIPSLCI